MCAIVLQRLISNDRAKGQEIMREIQFLKHLSGHPNIIRFMSAASDSTEGASEFLLCTEYCEGKFKSFALSLAQSSVVNFPFGRIFYICTKKLSMYVPKMAVKILFLSNVGALKIHISTLI